MESVTRFLEKPACETVTGCLIVANTIVMMIETQYEGLVSGYTTGLPWVDEDPTTSWKHANKVFMLVDKMFTVIFAIELLIRVLAHRCALFKQPLNWLDIIAVVVSLVQWAVEQIPVDLSILRLFRAARLARALRFMNLTKVLASLHILIKCIRSSMNILFWSLCLLMMIQCMVGMLACQVSQSYILDVSKPEGKRLELFMYFGTFTRAFITMFEVHMANWAKPCRVIMESVGEISGGLFVFYRCILGFAIMSVISAVFVQQTMSVVQNDEDIMIMRKRKEAEGYNRKLKSLFRALDTDEDRCLCREEFDQVKTNNDLKVWMGALDIDPNDLDGLFDLLDNGDDLVSLDEFLSGATRVRGFAKSIDLAQLQRVVDRLDRTMTDLHSKFCPDASLRRKRSSNISLLSTPSSHSP